MKTNTKTCDKRQHRSTQDFTMEGVHVVGAGPGDLGEQNG